MSVDQKSVDPRWLLCMQLRAPFAWLSRGFRALVSIGTGACFYGHALNLADDFFEFDASMVAVSNESNKSTKQSTTRY